MAVKKVVFKADARKILVTKLDHNFDSIWQYIRFFQKSENDKRLIQKGAVYNTKLVGNTISVGDYLVTEDMRTSTIQEIKFIDKKKMVLKTRNSFYEVQLID